MYALNRVKVGRFEISDAISIEELEAVKGNAEEKIIKVEDIFRDVPEVIFDEKRLGLFLNGVKLRISERSGVCRVYDKEMNFIRFGDCRKWRDKKRCCLGCHWGRRFLTFLLKDKK